MQHSALLSVMEIWIDVLKWGHPSSYLNLVISLPQALWGIHVFLLAYFQASCVGDCQKGLLMQMRWGYSFLNTWNFLIPNGEFYITFTQSYINKIKMKTSDPQDLSPSKAGTGNSFSLGLAQMSVWCLMTMLKAAVMYVVLKHPFQGCAKNARASLILHVFSNDGFDRKKCWVVTLREALW